MAKPERFQMPLQVEFGGRRAEEPAAVCQAIFDSLAAGQPESSRFVRAMREEITFVTPGDVANHLLRRVYTPFDQFDQEEFWTCLLNSRNRLTHEVMVYRGTVNTVRVRLAEVFKEAVRTNAASIVISRCHPSRDPTPSPKDVRLTESARQIAEMLEISLLDHIVVGHNRWVSMRERGLGFGR